MQGSELMILRGAGDLLKAFRYIKTEAADFEAYRGGCTAADLSAYLAQFGFHEISRKEFARKDNVDAYFDITFEREDKGERA